MSKFEFTGETKVEFGVTLKRIRATASFGFVAKGDLGGWLQAKDNLSVEGDAWVAGNALVWGNALVAGDALVEGDALVAGYARVAGDARVEGYARVEGNALVAGYARVAGYALVAGYARVAGDARVAGYARVEGDARVEGNARVWGNADLLLIGPIGSRHDWLTATATASGQITVRTGCFLGTLDAFAAAVAETHGDNEHGQAYRAAIALIRIAIKPKQVEKQEAA